MTLLQSNAPSQKQKPAKTAAPLSFHLLKKHIKMKIWTSVKSLEFSKIEIYLKEVC